MTLRGAATTPEPPAAARGVYESARLGARLENRPEAFDLLKKM